MTAIVKVADWAPCSPSSVGSKCVGIKLWMDLGPGCVVVCGCPLAKISVVVQPRWVGELDAMLHDHELICYQFLEAVWVPRRNNHHICAVCLHPGTDVWYLAFLAFLCLESKLWHNNNAGSANCEGG